jgi:NAD(P)-dependent dehydrogenase (short-subunit alcohol dehydrogenase family)
MSPAEAVVAEIRALGGGAVANFDDITDFEAAARIVGQAVETFGSLDVLVNNAGFTRDRMFVNCTPDEWDAVIRVHLRGHFCVTNWACQYWRGQVKRGLPVDARIINTSSGAGLQGSVGQSAYSAAKGGIASLTLVQAEELARYGITANALAPAARTRMTETVFADSMKAPESGFDIHDPANVAPLVTWLASAEARDVTGCVFEVKGGMIMIAEGWRDGPMIDRGSRWHPAEVGEAVMGLVARRAAPKPVYGAVG